ncbi:MAG: AAA family ATPase [bacterium]|nr:AAA family ATPase [bacterium]
MEIPVLAVTGGPCSGKSSLTYIREDLEKKGFTVLIIPEVATELFMSGIKVGKHGITNRKFQEMVLEEQISREKKYKYRAELMPGKKKVIICERGAMDGKAYLAPKEFTRMIHEMGYRTPQLRDERYTAVFHLVSAAIGVEKFYTTANNPARKEKTKEEAALLDIKTRAAWVGHPHLRVIDNSTDFKGKMKRLLKAIERSLGIPEPLEIEKKYLIKRPDFCLLKKEYGAVPVMIEQFFLDSKKGNRCRIRDRRQDGYSVYYQTAKQKISSGVRREVEKRIAYNLYSYKRDYERDPSRNMIRKKRHYFLWQNQYFELDLFFEPKQRKGLSLLEIELDEVEQAVCLPPCIEVIADVTDNPVFTNFSFAKNQ